jgi:hypothetical protein
MASEVEIPDEAVSLFSAAAHHAGAGVYMSGGAWRVEADERQIRAGLAAAWPLLGAATRPPMCGDAVTGVGTAVLVCTQPAGHDGWHGDWNGSQWSSDKGARDV